MLGNPCASTALISPAARRKLTSLADLASHNAVWGKIACEARLSAIAMGLMSLTGTNILGQIPG